MSAVNLRKTECLNGHPFDNKNTYIRKDDGNRQCKKCSRARGLRPAQPIAKICVLCGKNFVSFVPKSRYCSSACGNTSRSRKFNGALQRTGECSGCGAMFSTWRSATINCSKKCSRTDSLRKKREYMIEYKKRKLASA